MAIPKNHYDVCFKCIFCASVLQDNPGASANHTVTFLWHLHAFALCSLRDISVKHWNITKDAIFANNTKYLHVAQLMRSTLTLNAPIATKVVCFFRVLNCLRSLNGKQCRPRSDCSYRSSLFWVHAVYFYTKFVGNVRQIFAADDFSRRHYQTHSFLAY